MRRGSATETDLSGRTGPIPWPRIHSGEWLVCAGGLTVVVGLFMTWSDGLNAFESFSVLKVLMLMVGLGALALPVVVALSARTDLPIIWETFLSTAALFVGFLLFLKLLWPPSEGLGAGFFVVCAGSLLIAIAGWLSVAREC